MQPKELVGVDLNAHSKTRFLNNLQVSNTSGYFKNLLNELDDSEKNSFDLVTAIGVFELNDEQSISVILNKAQEMLNEKGRFLSIYYPWSYLSPIYSPLIFKGGRIRYQKDAGFTVYSHKLRSIKKLAIDAGLTLFETGCINPYPSLLWRSDKLWTRGFHIKTKQDFFCYGGRYIIAGK